MEATMLRALRSHLVRAATIALFGACAIGAPARAQQDFLESPNANALAVEFFHAGFGHYFVTSDPGEAAVLDQGILKGWQRTGESFPVYSAGQFQSLFAFPVCRFFTVTFAPLSSHFYTPIPAECEFVKQNPNWQYEGLRYQIMLPNAQGLCMGGTAVLYRLYNDGQSGAPNHRYTKRYEVTAAMRAQGWVREGHVVTHAFACTPADPQPQVAVPFDGLWGGTTTSGFEVALAILENKSAWVIHMEGGSIRRVDKTTQTLQDARSGSQLRRFDFTDGRSKLGGINIGVVPNLTAYVYSYLSGVPDSIVEFNASYVPAYELPAAIANVAGKWTGLLATTGSGINAPLPTQTSPVDISETGQIVGTTSVAAAGSFGGDCTYQGTILPRASGKNVYNVNVAFAHRAGGLCDLADRPFVGIAFESSAVLGGPRTLVIVAQGQTNQANAIAWSGTLQ
jgi:hypothetical protein